MTNEGEAAIFSHWKCHFWAMALLCLSLLCQLCSKTEAADDSAKMPFAQSVRRHFHPIGGGRPTIIQHGHNNFRDETNVVAASPIQAPHPQHQQSFAVAAPQASPHVAFDYGATKLAAAAPSSYGSASEAQPAPAGDEDGTKEVSQRKNATPAQTAQHNNALPQQPALQTTAAQNVLEQRRVKRRCPREAGFVQADAAASGGGMHNPTAARISHRVVGHAAPGTEYASGPRPTGTVAPRVYAAQTYAAPTRSISSVSKSRGSIGPEYEQTAAEQSPPSVKPPSTRTKAQPAGSAPCNTQRCNGRGGPGDHSWAYIKKPKKGGSRPAGGGAAQHAVTPPPAAGTALGGLGKYFTALPQGVKGTHYQTINSKNLPTLNDAHRYYYPPRMPLPLATCFHNPTGYPCCNPALNDLMVETYTDLESKPKFHTCNINAIALHLQIKAEERFNTSFETVAAFDDFAQKIHFYSDLVCKVELGGKFLLAYGTVKDVDQVLNKDQSEATNYQQDQSSSSNSNGGGATPNYVVAPPRTGGSYPATAIRQKREHTPLASAPFVGPLLPHAVAAAADELSRHYSMWI
ncbi:hypothetical protein niasHT_034525 [Heterodera trifolii]|uniref:Ground-like domain-containing protein n=1 Tax=Heterodera trifolii TaxID=157864 RepID=A0ABD2I489_9BILA